MKILILIITFLFLQLSFSSVIENHLRIEALGIAKKDSFVTETSSQELPGLEASVGLNYELAPLLLTVTKLRASGGTSNGSTRKDEDLVSTAGNKIRLVSESNKNKYLELGLEQMFGYRFEGPFFDTRVEYHPFITLGHAYGNATSTKEIMTDRAHFKLFSNHNRYTYSYDQEYERRSIGTGFEILIAQKLICTIGYRYSAYRFKNMNTSVDVNGEAPEFVSNDIAPPSSYSNQHNAETYVGLGYQF